jgi:hypothetical protein
MANVIYAAKQSFELNGGGVGRKLSLARMFAERFALEEAECHLNAPGIGEHMLTGTAVREQKVEISETQPTLFDFRDYAGKDKRSLARSARKSHGVFTLTNWLPLSPARPTEQLVRSRYTLGDGEAHLSLFS